MKSWTKRLFCFILVAMSVLLPGICLGNSQIESTTPVDVSALPRSMKGYELYSWQAEGNWNFTLITGTNRLKSVNEITTGLDTVKDGWVKLRALSVEALKAQLARLPRDASIRWMSNPALIQFGVEAGPLKLPPQAIVDAVVDYCKKHGLNLQVSP
jgi:hypothetical protein